MSYEEAIFIVVCLSQTCIDFQCVNASALLPDFNCDAQTTCHGNGVRLSPSALLSNT